MSSEAQDGGLAGYMVLGCIFLALAAVKYTCSMGAAAEGAQRYLDVQRVLFDRNDTNRDGVLNGAEVRAFNADLVKYRETKEISPLEAETERMKQYDLDESGFLETDEQIKYRKSTKNN